MKNQNKKNNNSAKNPVSRFRHVTWLKHTTVQAYLSHNSRSTCFIGLTYLPNGAGSMELQFGFVYLPTDHLLTEQDLHNGQASVCPSVRPSVCSIDRRQQRRPAGLLLSAVVSSRHQSIAAGAVAALKSPALSSKRGGQRRRESRRGRLSEDLLLSSMPNPDRSHFWLHSDYHRVTRSSVQ